MSEADAPAPGGLVVFGIGGLPDIRPGHDLVELIAAATRQSGSAIRDGDVLVVTSKIVSKAEGRLVSAPTDPEERDALRRRLIDQETVRLVAQAGRTKIVENRLGLVAAAAGIDASNVRSDEIALLPKDPDGTAEAIVLAFAELGLRVGVVITDTQGRAWRNGVIDVAIGAAGIDVIDDHRGGVDRFGNELAVTQVAVGDEIAAAADLVKGKLAEVPVAVVRGLGAEGLPVVGEQLAGRADLRQKILRGGGRELIRPSQEDLFRLGTDLAIEAGRRDASAPVPPGHALLHAEVSSVLRSWRPSESEPEPALQASQSSLREAFLGFLGARPDATARSCVPGHVTASVVVLSADRDHVLFTLHRRVGRWVQLGGHCEGEDGSIAQAALREATEESGIDGLRLGPAPIQLDVHPITCSLGLPTRHFDIRFAGLAPIEAVPVVSPESRDLRWWPVDALPEDTEDSLRRAVTLAVRALRRPGEALMPEASKREGP
jgi:coenzyme F420-0:L-glutamate ligase